MTAASMVTAGRRTLAGALLWRLITISSSMLCLAANSVFALNPRLAFTQCCRQDWAVETELPYSDRAVFALAQTPDGYLWIGADKGLLRFDGVRFTLFNTKSAPAPGALICQTPARVSRDRRSPHQHRQARASLRSLVSTDGFRRGNCACRGGQRLRLQRGAPVRIRKWPCQHAPTNR